MSAATPVDPLKVSLDVPRVECVDCGARGGLTAVRYHSWHNEGPANIAVLVLCRECCDGLGSIGGVCERCEATAKHTRVVTGGEFVGATVCPACAEWLEADGLYVP